MGPVFRWRERESGEGLEFGVDWAFTDRWGGASQEPYDEFNLGAHVGDLAGAVETNRHRLAHALRLSATQLRFMDQVHGTDVLVADVLGRPAGMDPPTASCDGIVTDSDEVALVVLVADCTPVLLVDRVAGLAGAVHAGRKGMVGGVVPAAVERLRQMGAERLEAVVGPSICPRCYEVPAALRQEAADVVPSAWSVSARGTPAIDVAAGVVEQLSRADVPLRWLPGCSREDEGLYSHRRSGTTGRYAGVIRLLPKEGAA